MLQYRPERKYMCNIIANFCINPELSNPYTGGGEEEEKEHVHYFIDGIFPFPAK
jgi:hypothetical protein